MSDDSACPTCGHPASVLAPMLEWKRGEAATSTRYPPEMARSVDAKNRRMAFLERECLNKDVDIAQLWQTVSQLKQMVEAAGNAPKSPELRAEWELLCHFVGGMSIEDLDFAMINRRMAEIKERGE